MAKYRMLKKGEIVQAGDEVLENNNKAWALVSMSIGGHVIPEYEGAFRRPIPAPRKAKAMPMPMTVWRNGVGPMPKNCKACILYATCLLHTSSYSENGDAEERCRENWRKLYCFFAGQLRRWAGWDAHCGWEGMKG